MRLTGVLMVSVDQDCAFPGKHLLQLGIRLGYLTVISRVWYLVQGLYVVWLDRRGEMALELIIFHPMIVEKYF